MNFILSSFLVFEPGSKWRTGCVIYGQTGIGSSVTSHFAQAIMRWEGKVATVWHFVYWANWSGAVFLHMIILKQRVLYIVNCLKHEENEKDGKELSKKKMQKKPKIQKQASRWLFLGIHTWSMCSYKTCAPLSTAYLLIFLILRI